MEIIVIMKRKVTCLAFMGILGFLPWDSAHAIIVDIPLNGSDTTDTDAVLIDQSERLVSVLREQVSESVEFPYLDHIGMVGMGSGVYLGDGYVLTSAHVGCYPFRLPDGSYYQPDYQSWSILTNSAGGQSDLAVFRVSYSKDSALGKLGVLPIAMNDLDRDQPILMFGSGLRQNSEPSVLRSNGKILAIIGYRMEGKRATAWGLNRPSEILEEPVATNRYFTHCFVTEFNQGSYEAQATSGDSGGAAFRFDSRLNRWELVGCIIGVTQTGSYVPFGTQTYLANLSRYRTQFPNAEPSPETVQDRAPESDAVLRLASGRSGDRDDAETVSNGAGKVEVLPAVIGVKFPD